MRRENEEREQREQARLREEEMRRMDEQVARERKAKEERERQAATAELRKLQGRAFDEKEAAGLSLMELNVRVLSARDVAKKEREERVAKDSERQLFLARALREAALPGLKELFATQHATEVAYWEQAFETQYEQKKKQNEKLAVLKPVCERLQAHLEGYAMGVVTRRAEAVREVVEKRFEEAEAKRKAEEEKRRAEEEERRRVEEERRRVEEEKRRVEDEKGNEEEKKETEEEKKREEKKGETKEETKPAEEEPAEEKKAEEEKEPEEKEKAEEKKPEEQKVEEKPEEKEEKGTPDLEVKNNGIEIKMWMKCEEGSCVLDVERSGSYDSFSDLTDCETSVQLKYKDKSYMLPTPLRTDHDTLKEEALHVSLFALLDG